jgi:hypothetical protein
MLKMSSQARFCGHLLHSHEPSRNGAVQERRVTSPAERVAVLGLAKADLHATKKDLIKTTRTQQN